MSDKFALRVGILCLGLALGPSLFAAKPYSPKIANALAEPWRWNHYRELEGKGVRYLTQAPNNKVWVSCNEGVLEYDGYRWNSHAADNGFRGGAATGPILATHDGTVYVTTAHGVFRYLDGKWHDFFLIPEGRTFIFHNIKALPNGDIIVCSDWGVIRFIGPDEVQFFTTPTKIAQLSPDLTGVQWVELPESALSRNQDIVYASDVIETTSGDVWMSLTTGPEVGKLLKFRWSDAQDGKLSEAGVFSEADGFSFGKSQILLEAKNGEVWVANGSTDKGIYIFDGDHVETILLNKLFGCDELVSDLAQSEDGTIWVGSMAKLISCKDGRWQTYRAPEFPVPANHILFQNGKPNQLWVHGYKSRVLLLDLSANNWLTYENLSYQCTTSDGTEWFLEYSNRLVSHKNNRWISYGVEDGIIDTPTRIINTSRQQLWVAGSHRGKAATARLTPSGWHRQLHPDFSWGIDYRSVFEDSQGGLWLASAVDAKIDEGFISGLLYLPDPTAAKLEWIHLKANENGLNQRSYYGIGESYDGRIWVGGAQLRYFENGSWHTLPDKRLQQYVNFVGSKNGLLLVGSRYYGLFVYDGHEWKNYSTKDGLADNTIISIDMLSDSSIVVATESSISRFDGRSWTNNILPEQFNMEHEGGTIFQSDTFIWINHVPRIWKRRAYQNTFEDENLLFRTTRYRPSQAAPDTKFDFFTEEVSADGNAIFSWSGTDYLRSFAGNDLTYSYRLDGGAWSAFSAKQEYTFNQLESGIHTLQVRARNIDHNIDPSPASVTFRVKQVFWRQTWFILLLLFFLLIYGIYEYRVITKNRKLEKLNGILKQTNDQLSGKKRQIEIQHREILLQQQQIVAQSQQLEEQNKGLATRNRMISRQRDDLEAMVEHIQRLSKAKLGFFTNISHELRTPLTLIHGPISQLLQSDAGISAEEKTRLYQIIERNSSRLLKLINQLLEIRRIEQSTLEVKLNQINLVQYLSQIVEMFRGLALSENIDLQFAPKNENVLVFTDTDKVEKIITNLLSNAFKCTPRGGRITLQLSTMAGRPHCADPARGEYFEVVVSDDGHGIARHELNAIFDKFYTTRPSASDCADSGIGLAYIKDLVNSMDGEIKVESKLGRGTSFTVRLPLNYVERIRLNSPPAPPEQKQAPKEATGRTRTKPRLPSPIPREDNQATTSRILVVEDNLDMQQFLGSILASKYEVSTADNGLLATELIQEHTFDLVISDVMMPELNGLDFCARIKSDIRTSHVPVILLTAKTLDEHKLNGFSRGADDYITKPFNSDLLIARIDNLLKQREILREVYQREILFTPKTEKALSLDEQFIAKLSTLMKENLGASEFNVEAMCRAMHISHMHFFRKVKQLTGKKPIELLRSVRMKKARHLLSQQKFTVAEVAYQVGFDLPNSFTRAFKKEFDLTPTQFIGQLPKARLVTESYH